MSEKINFLAKSNSTIALCEFHIKDAKTTGHYLERAYSLAKVISDEGYKTCLVSAGAHSLAGKKSPDVFFDEHVFEPGFSSFGQPEISCMSSTDSATIKLFNEAICRYSLKYSFNSMHIDDGVLNIFTSLLNDNNFIEVFSVNTVQFYCASPEATILFCNLYLRLTNFVHAENLHSDTKINSDILLINELKNIWLRVKREANAYVSYAAERLLQKYSGRFSRFIFLTASVDQLIAGIRHVSKENYDGPSLSFIHHQPQDFTPECCYNLTSELNRIPVKNRHKIIIYLSCEEFKTKLSSHTYSFFGEHANFAIGPFFQRSKYDHKYDGITPRGDTIARHYLKARECKEWIFNATKIQNFREIQFDTTDVSSTNRRSFYKSLSRFVQDNLFTFTFLGDIRDEKNFSFYVEICIEAWNSNINIIAVHPCFFSDGLIIKSEKAFKLLTEHPSYQFMSLPYENHLSEKDYIAALSLSTMIFNAYDTTEYKYKQSGVFYEALLFGKRVCITPGTAMAVFHGKETNNLVEKFKITEVEYKYNLFARGNGIAHDFININNSMLLITAHDAMPENIGIIFTLECRFICLDSNQLVDICYITLQSGFRSTALTCPSVNHRNLRIEVCVRRDNRTSGEADIKIHIEKAKLTDEIKSVYEFACISSVVPLTGDLSSIFDFKIFIKKLFEHKSNYSNQIINDFRLQFTTNSIESMVSSLAS